MENALLLFSIAKTHEPLRNMTLDTSRYHIELSIYFGDEEQEVIDMMENILSVYKIEWADYRQIYLKNCNSYCMEYNWEIED